MSTLIRLDHSHLAAIIDLHHKVIADLPPGTAATETDQFFADHLDACGQIFGAFDHDRLMAYCVLGLPRKGDPNFGTDHSFAPDQLGHVAHIDGAAVAPEWRGLGWQRKMVRYRIGVAQRCGRTIVLSTVAPTNFPSLISMVSSGLAIHGLMAKFGGNRFLLRRNIAHGTDAQVPRPSDGTHWCTSDDIATCRTFLEQGFTGHFCQSSGHGKAPRIGWLRTMVAYR